MASAEESLELFRINSREYADQLLSSLGFGQKREEPIFGFVGRLLRGKKPEDFITLTDNIDRHIVFLLDAIALNNLIGLSGVEILKKIGYGQEFISELRDEGTMFKLVLFPESEGVLATWDNLFNLVKEKYPDWSERVDSVRETLENNTYDEVIARNDTASEVRLFLNDTLGVNGLFAGDGYTRQEGSDEQVYPEYLYENVKLSVLVTYALINLPIF